MWFNPLLQPWARKQKQKYLVVDSLLLVMPTGHCCCRICLWLDCKSFPVPFVSIRIRLCQHFHWPPTTWWLLSLRSQSLPGQIQKQQNIYDDDDDDDDAFQHKMETISNLVFTREFVNRRWISNGILRTKFTKKNIDVHVRKEIPTKMNRKKKWKKKTHTHTRNLQIMNVGFQMILWRNTLGVLFVLCTKPFCIRNHPVNLFFGQTSSVVSNMDFLWIIRCL